jgi:lipoprotein-releasing system permease protein
MKTSFFIAKRYLLSKKSHNLINVISAISVIGLAIGTFALIVVLSVFNGFESVIKSLYGVFNPDFEITALKGKTFSIDSIPQEKIKAINGIIDYSEVVEEDALFKYGDKQFIGKIKGVDENFSSLSGVDSMVVDGYFVLNDAGKNYAVVGAGVAYFLDLYPEDVAEFLNIYVPKRGNKSSFNIAAAFNQKAVHPSGVFSIQQDFDEKYVFLPLAFVRELMDYDDEITSLEVFTGDEADNEIVQEQLKNILGDSFIVKNRYEQNVALFKVMTSEKTAIFFILVFILVLASFNMIGSLSILIVEKKKDIAVLKSMGADKKLIKNIFTIEGMLISILGGLIGLFLGFMVLYLQQTFGIVSLGSGEGDFIIDAYPVKMKLVEFVYVFATVQLIGFLATIYPVNFLLKNFDSVKL